MILFADHDKAMPLNELGDFFAGVFSPLAFLFLYLGYKQQGKELKQNTEALKLQAQELSNLVKEQEKQNSIHEYGMNTKRIESKPIIDFKQAGYTYRIYDFPNDFFEGTTFYFNIVNYGNVAKDIQITGKGIDRRLHKLESDIVTSISFSYSDEMERELHQFQGKPLAIELDLAYCDNSGYQYHKKIKLFTDDFVVGAVDMDWDMNINFLD